MQNGGHNLPWLRLENCGRIIHFLDKSSTLIIDSRSDKNKHVLRDKKNGMEMLNYKIICLIWLTSILNNEKHTSRRITKNSR